MHEIKPPTKQVFSSVARCIRFLRAFVAATNKLTVRLSYLSDSAAVCMQCVLSHADIVCNYMLMISIGSLIFFVGLKLPADRKPPQKLCCVLLEKALLDQLRGSESKFFFCLLFSTHKNRDKRPCSFLVY